jgi:hypothetical protein
MKAKLLLIFSCLLLSTVISAENKPQWVVGSFTSEYHALLEVERIQAAVELDLGLVSGTANGQEVFRLITDIPGTTSERQQLRDDLSAIRIEGVWVLNLGAGEKTTIATSSTSVRQPQEVSQAIPEPAPAPDPLPEPVAETAPEPAPVETVEPEVVSDEPPFEPDKPSHFDFCINEATAAEREQYCGNQEFSERTRNNLSPEEEDLVQRAVQ